MRRLLIAALALASATAAKADTDRMAAMTEAAYIFGACYWRGTPAEQAQVVRNLTGDTASQSQEEREWRASLLATYEEGKREAPKLTAPQCDRLLTGVMARLGSVDRGAKSP